jgi:arylsulfatase A-like enzyme
LHDGPDLETDSAAISSDLHNGYLLTSKVVDTIHDHAMNYAEQPLFLYVASQLIHEEWQAPETFIQRCIGDGQGQSITSDQSTYCAMNLMVDEMIANITCALQSSGLAENTLMIVASDNGGVKSMPGNSYPYRGGKGNFFR